MAPAIVVADASALICLRWVDQLSILPGLFGRVVMPPAAAAETTRRGSVLPIWVEVRPPAVRPVLDLLLAKGFRLSLKVYELILKAADERRG